MEQMLFQDLLGFDLYRDGNLIDTVGPDVFTYMDSGLENGTQYCYYIIASYDEGDSQPTAEVCAAPDAGPMCPPENFSAIAEDGATTVSLDWTPPLANCENRLIALISIVMRILIETLLVIIFIEIITCYCLLKK